MSDGAHLTFFKRTAPDEFRCLGFMVEGLEAVEEFLGTRMGVDVHDLAAQIKKSGDWAKTDADTQYDDPTGMLIGGLWHENWDRLERHYADVYSTH